MGIERSDRTLYDRYRLRVHAEFIYAQPQNDRQINGIGCHLATHKNLDSFFLGADHRVFQQTNDGRLKGMKKVRHLPVSAVDGQRILNQIIGADTKKIDLVRNDIRHDNR